LLACLALASWYCDAHPAQAQTVPDEPPVAGRPDDFSDVVGVYSISSTAQPTELCVEDPLVLKVRITGSGPGAYQPRRRHLSIFPPAMKDDFYVEPLPDQDRALPDQKTWEFTYRLRPKRQDVKWVHSLKLVYYSPGRQRFQSTYSDKIDLVVKPRSVTQAPPDAVRSVQPPARIYELATGPGVLRRQERATMPAGVFFVLLLAPPMLCALWYLRWRYVHPDNGRVVRQSRSRAAQRALQSLCRDQPLNADDVFTAVSAYLRSRLDIAATEPTQTEVSRRLTRLGVGKPARQEVVVFFKSCDAARFAPSPLLEVTDLASAAIRVVTSLENEPCLSPFRTQAKRHSSRGVTAGVCCLVLVLFGPLEAPAQLEVARTSETDLLSRAEAAFLEGKKNVDKPAAAREAFARSAALYQELLRRGAENPDLWCNLGNAEFLAGRLGDAVFAYRTGLRLAPGDANLQANLGYARSRVQYPAGAQPPDVFWPAVLPQPNALLLQWSLVGFWAPACISWLRRLVVGGSIWLPAILTCAVLLAGAGLGVIAWQNLQEERYPLVVVAADRTDLYRGNGPSYPRHPTLAVVNEGMAARCLVERGDWLQIQFPGAQIGWVRTSAMIRSPQGWSNR
jgi:hypothetical protein